MTELEAKKEEAPVIVIVERRRRHVELSSAEVMKILRKRAAKRGSNNTEGA